MSNDTTAVIFDMDGVLVDSVPYNWQAVNEVLARYGIHIADQDLRKYIGRSFRSILNELSADNGLSLEYDEINPAITEIKQKLMANLPPKEGVVELLELLQANSIPFAVATSSAQAEAERKLSTAGILDYFRVVITEEDVSTHKPNPAVYLKAAQLLGVSPERCVVFEDSPAGIQAANQAGTKCIAIKTPYTNADDLSEATVSVTSLADVTIKFIKSL
ncbi:HAD family phosphatase [Candidatus Saccharibacteria bacterium]|nr:HAD family phosphatase [Candidatus Saccharibacteria bacterium]